MRFKKRERERETACARRAAPAQTRGACTGGTQLGQACPHAGTEHGG